MSKQEWAEADEKAAEALKLITARCTGYLEQAKTIGRLRESLHEEIRLKETAQEAREIVQRDLREDRAEVERMRDELRKLIIENERLIQTSPDIGAVASRQRKETQEALIRVVMEVTGASPWEIEIVETLGPDGLHTHVGRRP